MLLLNKFQINLKVVKQFKTSLFYRNNKFHLEVKIRTLNVAFGCVSRITFAIVCLFQVFKIKHVKILFYFYIHLILNIVLKDNGYHFLNFPIVHFCICKFI